MGTTTYGGKGSKGRAANGDRPVGAASCRREQHTMGSCQPPPHASAGMLLTTTSVGNVTQGYGVLGHQVLPIGGAKHTQTFCQLCRVFPACVVCQGGGGWGELGRHFSTIGEGSRPHSVWDHRWGYPRVFAGAWAAGSVDDCC